MALLDDIKDEIKKAHAPKAPERTEKKPEKKRRQKTKEEIAAFIAKKQAEEERRYLKQQESNAEHHNSPGAHKARRRRSTDEHPKEPKDTKATDGHRRGRIQKQKGSCSKIRPKTVKTIDLPDGGSLLIIYMPGKP